MNAIYKWVKGMLGEMRYEIKPPQENIVAVLGEFMNSHINNAVVVNGGIDARTKMEAAPIVEPRGELMIRYEPDTKELFIAVKAFRDFCVRNQINYKGTLKELQKTGVFIEPINKRLSKGMKVVSPAVRVLKFDASKSEFLQIGASADENRDPELPNQLA
jgi:hypothetical protein